MSKQQTKDYHVISADTAGELKYKINSSAKKGLQPMSKQQTNDYRVISADTAGGLEYKINTAAKKGFVVTNTFVKPLPDNHLSPLQYIAFMERTF